jgi:regulator of replication initiation timing
MKLKDVKNINHKDLNSITEVLQELITENLEVDLEGEDLENTLNIEVTDNMLDDIANTIMNNDEWDYFDIMKVLKIA